MIRNAIISLVAVITLLATGCGQTSVTDGATLKVLSNRVDLVSAGDVLVEVIVDSAETIDKVILTRNAANVTDVLVPTAANPLRLLGLVEGLGIGENVIALNLGNSVTVTNHPAGGPLFTGPHIQPWACQESAADAECNQAADYTFLYRPTDTSNAEFKDYDPENPPNDIAMTTTDNGETIPFIVRRERGYQGRDQYYIFTLFKPAEEWTAANPQSQWNGRLVVPHGGNCRGNHETSSPRTADYAGTIPENPAIANTYVTALGLGWSVFSAAQMNLGHNCNVTYQAEALMMGKERFVEQYGELRYTVGTGCSGGAITQNMIANSYPGLYNGLTTTCTYPDLMSTATQFADYHILIRYFGTDIATETALNTIARDGTSFTKAEQDAIYGHLNGQLNASLADSALFAEAVDPASGCGGVPGTAPGDSSTRFREADNPAGVRCDVLSFMKNIVGERERFPTDDPNGIRDHWSQLERDLGYGFAGFPLGNEGVQYGLVQLQTGVITPAQFLGLNVNIGSLDPSLNIITTRLKVDYPALPNAYRSGILNTVVNMDTVPVINMTGPDPGAAHDAVHGYWVRWRLDNEFGHHDNWAHWGGSTPLIGNPAFMNQSLLAMADWLDAIEADTSDTTLAAKIIANRPASAADRCEVVPGEMCPEEQMTVFGTPRTEAGAGRGKGLGRLGDQIQCALKPFNRSDDYGPANQPFPVGYSDEQWEQLEAALDVDPDENIVTPMVCDWTQRPLGWQPTITWLNYQDELGQMVTGGEQIAPAPYPAGWGSDSFDNTWTPGWQSSN
jgi:hypothetical protein